MFQEICKTPPYNLLFSACRNFVQCFVQCNQASSLPSLVFMVLPREQCFCCLDCGGGLSYFCDACFIHLNYGWPEYKWYYLYSCRNFLFFFPVWHSEGKTRRILLGFEQKRLYPLMNRIIVTFGENANMRWEKIIIICFLACHWCQY